MRAYRRCEKGLGGADSCELASRLRSGVAGARRRAAAWRSTRPPPALGPWMQPWVPGCRARERRPLGADAAAHSRGWARTRAGPRSGRGADGRDFVRVELRLYRPGWLRGVVGRTPLVAAAVGAAGVAADLEAITCPSATECIAVGEAGTGLIAVLLTDRQWSEQTLPTPPAASFPVLSSVSCSSPSSCMAVGYSSSATTPSGLLVEKVPVDQASPSASRARTRTNALQCAGPTSEREPPADRAIHRGIVGAGTEPPWAR